MSRWRDWYEQGERDLQRARPEELLKEDKLLDLYYIPPRYPDGFASGKPARRELLGRLEALCQEAALFPGIREGWLFGPVAKGQEAGLGDVDPFLLLERSPEQTPLLRLKPYYSFFSERLCLALDMLAATEQEAPLYRAFLKDAPLLFRR